MGTVPQKILNWMYNVLKGEYHDPDRTYSDVAQTISRHPNLTLRTNVYTYENGRTSLLLNIAGTLPTVFRGTTYMFPISIWIPHEYPRAVPIAFATPAANMVIRSGQYVSGEGRIYHPYLAGWREDQSNLLRFVSIIQEIFAREPPLIAKQEELPQQIPDGGPPPVPPLPPEIERSSSRASIGPQPPPPPPKPFETRSQPETQKTNGPPPVPPRPTQFSEHSGSIVDRSSNLYGRPPPTPGSVPQRSSSLRHSFSPEPSDYRGSPSTQRNPRHDTHGTGISSADYRTMALANPRQIPQGQNVDERQPPVLNGYQNTTTPQPRWNLIPPKQPPQQASIGQQYQQQRFPEQPHDPSQQYLPPQTPSQQYPPSQPQSQAYPPQPNTHPRKPPPTDLLTSPFDTPLPATNPQSTAPPPPIPPNPQKDALLSALSSTLTSTATSMHQSNTTAIPALTAQRTALTSTLNNINSEISSLESLSALLTSNESILHSSMSSADNVLSSTKTRSVPNIDDVLVAPTRVEGQLYEVVCEERAIAETRAFLARCLDRGRIGGETWARQTRGLAREEFAKRWLGRKIARGLGLRADEGLGRGGSEIAGGGGGGEGWYK